MAFALYLAASSGAFAQNPVPVTVDNFARAESDVYMGNLVKDAGGLSKLAHHREPAPIDHQTIIRLDRDTLYSFGVFDLDAGQVTITMPDAGDRFMSLQVINEDHYVPAVYYRPGSHTLTRDAVGTRYVVAAIRTLADPADPKDLAQVHALQDAIKISQSSPGKFEVPNWDPESQKESARFIDARRTHGRFQSCFRHQGPGRSDQGDLRGSVHALRRMGAGRGGVVRGDVATLARRGAAAARWRLRIAVFTLLAVSGPLLWLWYNQHFMHDPLDFMRGPYSAPAIEKRTSPPGSRHYRGWHNPGWALLLYTRAAQVVAAAWETGFVVMAAALAGLWMLVRKRANLAALLLWVPLAFYVYSIAYGSVPIFIPQLWPHSYYNSRYGLELLPALALFACVPAAALEQRMKRAAVAECPACLDARGLAVSGGVGAGGCESAGDDLWRYIGAARRAPGAASSVHRAGGL